MSDERRVIEKHDRTVEVTVEERLDRFGQFRVALSVDGKERWAAYFTDNADAAE